MTTDDDPYETRDPRALLNDARAARDRGQLHEAADAFRAVLDRHPDPATAADARVGLAGLLHARGETRAALDHLHAALRLREQLGNAEGAAGVQLNLGILHSDQGDTRAALDHFRRAWEVLRDTRDTGRLTVLHTNLGRLYIDRGDLDLGERHTRDGLALIATHAPPRHHATLGLNLAEVLRRRGQHDEAAAQYRRVVDLAVDHRLTDVQQRALHGLALTRVALADVEGARELLFEALALARRLEDLDAELLAMSGLAEVSLAAGQLEIGRTDAELVLIRALEGGRLPWAAEGHRLLARACEAMGDVRGAADHALSAQRFERAVADSTDDA